MGSIRQLSSLEVGLRPVLDASCVYKDREGDAYCSDGREVALLKYLWSSPRQSMIRNNPKRVVDAIDQFAREEEWLMNIGPEKGAIVVDEIAKAKPRTMVEMGGYIGYSAVLFGDAVRRANKERGGKGVFYSLECDPLHAAAITIVVDLAGLQDTVKILIRPADEGIKELLGTGDLDNGIDMLFLDHYKPSYVTDLKLCEDLGLIMPGTVIVADNVVDPGNPPYLAYISATPEQKIEDAKGWDARPSAEELIEYFPKRYQELKEREYLNTDVFGNPRLIYETTVHRNFATRGDLLNMKNRYRCFQFCSKTLRFAKDGVSVTRCVGLRK
ncbi:MAG: hypothetical protein M1814_003727 [Vezdaea aestivalis]|nr:MAG: hypothetical protein M1814_003727 [Vezdaea aestivalis]